MRFVFVVYMYIGWGVFFPCYDATCRSNDSSNDHHHHHHHHHHHRRRRRRRRQ